MLQVVALCDRSGCRWVECENVFNGVCDLASRLNDTLKSEITDYHPIAISECARRSVEIVRRVRG